ncbi:NF-kappa-B-repressing factor [Nematostella vectensis]|uniref:NF-kappa-B-repressing factor n=1 Tax=Nematostella vectensis TaxID=45351 RepID=UPI002076E5A2|nr:NF-kappa-B-repressing factor [Nematostella vectensis]
MADEAYSWETDFQWRSRRNFIETWRDEYPEDRLASLAMCWSNMKFFGCRYPEKVESLVNEMESKCPPVPKPEKRPPKRSIIIENFSVYEPSDQVQNLNPISILTESAQKSKKTINFQELQSTNLFTCAVIIQDKLVATGEASNKKDAKRNAAENALDVLKACQPVVKKRKIDHDAATKVTKTELTMKAYEEASVIPESNLGNQLLRKMGWKGSGGIGKEGQGRAEPVMVTGVDGKQGLGVNQDTALHKGSVHKVILDFINSSDQDMKFSPELSKEDRALVHQLSKRYGLRHQSYGKYAERYLVISKNLYECEK